MPAGGVGPGEGSPRRRGPMVTGGGPAAALYGVDGAHDGVFVEVRRERELDEDGVKAVVVVEVEDAGGEGLLVDVLGEVEGVGVDASLLSGVALGADVGEG